MKILYYEFDWKNPIFIMIIGLFIYIFAYCFAYIISPRLNEIVNFEERLRRRIVKERNKKVKVKFN